MMGEGGRGGRRRRKGRGTKRDDREGEMRMDRGKGGAREVL